MKRICVYCGSTPGEDDAFAAAVQALAATMLQRDIGLVYGGADRGLMGQLANAVMDGGGHVTGIIPRAFAHRVAHRGLQELRVVESMHERKVGMFGAADACIALPGGFGTLEEILEILTWARLGMHTKPCALLNVGGYYDLLLQFLDHGVGSGFVKQAHRDLLYVEDDAGALLDACASHEPKSVDKWD